jgi:nucleotide-binding universal stress UspA family protein
LFRCSTVTTVSRILIPTDFSSPSDSALEYARMLAEHFGASIHLLHVVDDAFLGSTALEPPVYVPLPPQLREELSEDAAQRLRVRLERVQPLHADSAVECSTRSTADAIREFAVDHNIDLIVIGTRTHGGRGLARLFVGTVAEELVRQAPCPVVTVCEAADSGARSAA